MEKRMDYYRKKVYHFIDRFIKNQDLAEDLTQDVMIKIWSHRHRISQLSDPDNYILKMAKHHVLDHFKKLAREKEYQEEVWYHLQKRAQSVESNMVQNEDRKSTRLNSSHVAISYAVFCLKKKKTKTRIASK